jgi:Arc/MetJ-type ribon-helix-helix transcriptional regulator
LLSIGKKYQIYKNLKGAALMPKVSVEIPQELLDDLNRHVGDNKKFVSQSDAIRTAIRKMLDMMDDIDRRHGRLDK